MAYDQKLIPLKPKALSPNGKGNEDNGASIMRRLPILLCIALSACNALPRDPADTSARIESTRYFTVGSVDPSARDAPETARLLRQIEQRTGARPLWTEGSGETLLGQLDAGTLDLAIGRFAKTSPWQAEVAFGPALSVSGKEGERIELKTAMRNGENRWIMTVERASRAISTEARAQ